MKEHERVPLDPNLQTIIDTLKANKKMNPVARGGLEKELRAKGLSNYEIGTQLGCSEGSVRREIKAAELPETWCKRIVNGESVAKVLKAFEKRQREEQWRETLAEKGEEKAIIDKIEVALHEAFDAYGIDKTAVRENLLSEILRDAYFRQPPNSPVPQRYQLVPPDADFTKVMTAGAPKLEKDYADGVFWFSQVVIDMGVRLVRMAPDWSIRSKAVAQAQRTYAGLREPDWKRFTTAKWVLEAKAS